MNFRAPSVPLITVDPYFSIWSPGDALNFRETVHWTGAKQPILATVVIDGKHYAFLGYNRNASKIPQTALDINALSTFCSFENEQIRLFVRFMTPLLPGRYDILSRPVSYMAVSYEKKDPSVREVSVSVKVSSQICMNRWRELPVRSCEAAIDGVVAARMGTEKQDILNRSGDDLRIDWGYFYLGTAGAGKVGVASCWTLGNIKIEGEEAPKILPADSYKDAAYPTDGTLLLTLDAPMTEGEEKLVLFAYDDIRSIDYFGERLPSYWNKDGKTIEEAIAEAAKDYAALKDECDAFSDQLIADAYMAGGEKYADLLSLAYRQVIAAHKLAVTTEGELIWISKECFSNGCAATVDVSYPSIPLFLLYDPELVRAMMRPIYRFAASKAWRYDFAPHDAGRYPLVTGQVYGLRDGVLRDEYQMPVEECGNMILMETATALASKDASFADSHWKILEKWCDYLMKYGDDPENQLCTDDFAGHLAHNCNLSLKAIMGIEGMAILAKLTGRTRTAAKYRRIAKEKAESWLARAKNADGSYRLTFDREGTFSMKYNAVWDKIFGTKVFPAEFFENEIASNMTRFNRYGMPLDSRSDYTKSDWLVWTATMAKKQTDFKRFIEPLWHFYSETQDRTPMTDWFDTISCTEVGFQNRTVQGGLFIKLLAESKKCLFKSK